MAYASTSGQSRMSRCSRSTAKKTAVQRQPNRRQSAQLIEQTRHLMERTIEFVDHPLFDGPDGLHQIQDMRPDSIDVAQETPHSAPGLAFVSGMVQSPLLTPEEERYWFVWMNFLKWRAENNRTLLDLNHPDQKLVARIDSDLDESLRVRNKIVQGNLRLIVALARKLAGSLEQMSELISEGMVPLMRSVELFDISLGNRFSTYATWAVRNQMLRYLKRQRSLFEFSSGEDVPSLENLPDKRPLAEPVESGADLRLDAVNHLLSSLSERERLVITARYGLEGHPQGQSLADIAGQMGLSKERVRQIVLTSLTKLRNGISVDEFEAIV
jgi:RNA polymerase sigma factor (sigma-70 family)